MYQKYAQGDGRTDDPVHMEGIKLEHFVNAEPRGGLRLIEDHPKEASQNHIEDILHSGKIKGNNRWTMISPPMKKPMTAKREGSCRLLRPEMAWPEVQPPAQRAPKPTTKPPNNSRAQTTRTPSDSR